MQLFENYVLKNALSNKLGKKFKNEAAESVRKRIFDVTAPFSGLDGKDVKEYVAALNAFLENEKIKEYSETVSDEIKTVESKAAEQFYDKFVDIVDEMQVVLKDTTFSLYEFSETLKECLKTSKSRLCRCISTAFTSDKATKVSLTE